MNSKEAEKFLMEELEYFEKKSYAELVERVGKTLAYEKETAGGRTYQIEIHIAWDSIPQNAIRVFGSIDDGDRRAFFPFTDSILKVPFE